MIPLYNAFKQISNFIRYSNLDELDYNDKTINNSGDYVKKLDTIANNIIIYNIKQIFDIRGYISEESNDITFTNNHGKYIIAFDPLDGSSNINSNISIGSIYGVYDWDEKTKKIGNIVNAGYCLYGPSTILVITEKDSLNMYTLDQNYHFKFTSNITLDNKDKLIYSINQSNSFNNDHFSDLLNYYKQNKYNTRWIGTMVADCHRTLIQGGVFLYPSTTNNKNGKLRLLYEALPFAKIFHTANGDSWNENTNLLNTTINNIHQKIPVYLGTKKQIQIIKNYLMRDD